MQNRPLITGEKLEDNAMKFSLLKCFFVGFKGGQMEGNSMKIINKMCGKNRKELQYLYDLDLNLIQKCSMKNQFIRPILTTATTVILLTITSFSWAATSISGNWNMIHDDWKGTLVIYPPDQIGQYTEVVYGIPCTYSYYSWSGTYTSSNGITYDARGTWGGKDNNLTTFKPHWPCKSSNTIVDFKVSFNPSAPQRFVGYLSTQGRNMNTGIMAGYTWWSGYPFGWYAVRP